MSHGNEETEPAIFGLIAEFEDPHELIHAAQKTYDEGYREMDAYSPIPLHGLPEAIGCKKSVVPKIAFCMGMCGAVGGFMLQYATNGLHYGHVVSARPMFSWPSFMPITFESGVLAAGISIVFGMLALNGLPRLHHPIFNAPGFDRATTDRFFLCIEATDSKFDADATRAFLEGLKADSVSEVPND